MKKRLAIILSVIMLMSLMAVPVFAADPAPTVLFNGEAMVFTAAAPMIENGSTLVPLRAIFERIGAEVTWDGATQTVKAVKGDTTVILAIGSTAPTVNGKIVELTVPGKIIGGSTMVPLRFVAQSFGAEVNWDGTTRTITINAPGAPAAPATPAPVVTAPPAAAASPAEAVKAAITAFSPVTADMNLTGTVKGTPYGDLAVALKGPATIDASKAASAKFNADLGALGSGSRTAKACPFSEIIAGPEADGIALVSSGTLADNVISLTGVACPKSMMGILSKASDSISIDFVLTMDCKIKIDPATGKIAEISDIVLTGKGKTALGDYPSSLSGSIVYTY